MVPWTTEDRNWQTLLRRKRDPFTILSLKTLVSTQFSVFKATSVNRGPQQVKCKWVIRRELELLSFKVRREKEYKSGLKMQIIIVLFTFHKNSSTTNSVLKPGIVNPFLLGNPVLLLVSINRNTTNSYTLKK